jgi:hypothetical protein
LLCRVLQLTVGVATTLPRYTGLRIIVDDEQDAIIKKAGQLPAFCFLAMILCNTRYLVRYLSA